MAQIESYNFKTKTLEDSLNAYKNDFEQSKRPIKLTTLRRLLKLWQSIRIIPTNERNQVKKENVQVLQKYRDSICNEIAKTDQWRKTLEELLEDFVPGLDDQEILSKSLNFLLKEINRHHQYLQKMGSSLTKRGPRSSPTEFSIINSLIESLLSRGIKSEAAYAVVHELATKAQIKLSQEEIERKYRESKKISLLLGISFSKTT